VERSAVTAFLDAFGAEARAAGVVPESMAAESEAALAVLEPHRNRVLTRFAELVTVPDRETVADRT
jgi:hypothetical protein